MSSIIVLYLEFCDCFYRDYSLEEFINPRLLGCCCCCSLHSNNLPIYSLTPSYLVFGANFDISSLDRLYHFSGVPFLSIVVVPYPEVLAPGVAHLLKSRRRRQQRARGKIFSFLLILQHLFKHWLLPCRQN